MQVFPCNNLLRSLHPQVLVHHNKWTAPLAIKFQRLPKAVCSMCITRPTANSGLCVVIDIIATLRNQLVVNRASTEATTWHVFEDADKLHSRVFLPLYPPTS